MTITLRLPLAAALACAGLAFALAGCGVPPEDEHAAQTAVAGGGQAEAGDDADDDAEEVEASGGDAAHGKELFIACAACHGPEGKGIPNLGKDLTTSTFAADKTDAELVAFLKVGRDATDPLNTTGVAMPPKGGNPALSDDDLLDIVAYVRELEGR